MPQQYDAQTLALAAHLALTGDDIEDIVPLSYPPLYGEGMAFSVHGAEYAVLTDAEADRAWDGALESYIDDCLLPEVPVAFHNYFDHEAWKRDARMDGRGHALSSYDGDEHEECVDGEWFYIYRTN